MIYNVETNFKTDELKPSGEHIYSSPHLIFHPTRVEFQKKKMIHMN